MTAADAPEMKSTFAQSSHLKKGEDVNLHTIDPALHRVIVGVGWDAPAEREGFPVDLDASAFILNRDGKVRRDTDFVFYNNLETENGQLKHLGDNTSGEGDGDDEKIHIDLEALSYDIEKIAFTVTIHNASERQQSFGFIKNAFIRIINEDTGVEVAWFDLSEDASTDNAILFGELSRDGVQWRFKAMGDSHNGGLYRIAKALGVNVAAS